jgi:hypothetical protein
MIRPLRNLITASQNGTSHSALTTSASQTMDPSLPFQRPKIRLRSSSATLPKSPAPSSPPVGPLDTTKKHRHHHSVQTHHHVPHISRRHAKDTQQSSGDKSVAYWDPSKPLSRVEQSTGSPANGSRRVSATGKEGGERDVAWTVKPEEIAKERQRGRLRDK